MRLTITVLSVIILTLTIEATHAQYSYRYIRQDTTIQTHNKRFHVSKMTGLVMKDNKAVFFFRQDSSILQVGLWTGNGKLIESASYNNIINEDPYIIRDGRNSQPSLNKASDVEIDMLVDSIDETGASEQRAPKNIDSPGKAVSFITLPTEDRQQKILIAIGSGFLQSGSDWLYFKKHSIVLANITETTLESKNTFEYSVKCVYRQLPDTIAGNTIKGKSVTTYEGPLPRILMTERPEQVKIGQHIVQSTFIQFYNQSQPEVWVNAENLEIEDERLPIGSVLLSAMDGRIKKVKLAASSTIADIKWQKGTLIVLDSAMITGTCAENFTTNGLQVKSNSLVWLAGKEIVRVRNNHPYTVFQGKIGETLTSVKVAEGFVLMNKNGIDLPLLEDLQIKHPNLHNPIHLAGGTKLKLYRVGSDYTFESGTLTEDHTIDNIPCQGGHVITLSPGGKVRQAVLSEKINLGDSRYNKGDHFNGLMSKVRTIKILDFNTSTDHLINNWLAPQLASDAFAKIAKEKGRRAEATKHGKSTNFNNKTNGKNFHVYFFVNYVDYVPIPGLLPDIDLKFKGDLTVEISNKRLSQNQFTFKIVHAKVTVSCKCVTNLIPGIGKKINKRLSDMAIGKEGAPFPLGSFIEVDQAGLRLMKEEFYNYQVLDVFFERGNVMLKINYDRPYDSL